MNASTISELVGSSQYQAVADDSLKDEDNAAWVMVLEPEIRADWIQRISWIRLIDRAAESELIGNRRPQLCQLYLEWQQLLRTGEIQPQSSYREMLTGLRTCWLTHAPRQANLLCIQSWNRYVKAIIHYHTRNLVIQSDADYKIMLHQLGGSLFQVLPFLPVSHWRSAGNFGALDQFFNHLRDLHEDAIQGICYLPTDWLDRYGIDRREILELQAIHHPNYHQMMQDWLESALQGLYRRANPLIAADDLPPCWKLLRNWSLNRYRRIERVFRECDFDYIQFPQVYWQQVQQELPDLMEQAQRRQENFTGQPASLKCRPWQTWATMARSLMPLATPVAGLNIARLKRQASLLSGYQSYQRGSRTQTPA